MNNTRSTIMSRAIFGCRTMAIAGVVSIFACVLPYAAAVPIQYTIEDLTGLDTSIVRNDGILVALNVGSGTDQTVNDVLFNGSTPVGDINSNFGGTTTENGITLSYGADDIPNSHNSQYPADARNRYNSKGIQNDGNCADWGENASCTGNMSGIMENAVRTIAGSTTIPGADPGVLIDVHVSGLTVGKSYRLQLLMDVADERRRMAVIHDGQSTGELVTGLTGPRGPDPPEDKITGQGQSVLATFTADATTFDIGVHPWEGLNGVLNALAFAEVTNAGQLGDFDADTDVDGADFLLWQRDQGVGNLSDWQGNFGALSNATASLNAVPEPSTALLLLGSIAMLLRGSFRTRT